MRSAFRLIVTASSTNWVLHSLYINDRISDGSSTDSSKSNEEKIQLVIFKILKWVSICCVTNLLKNVSKTCCSGIYDNSLMKENETIKLIKSKHCFVLVSLFNDFENIVFILHEHVHMHELEYVRCSAVNQYYLVFDCTNFVCMHRLSPSLFSSNWNQKRKNDINLYCVDEKIYNISWYWWKQKFEQNKTKRDDT